MSVAQCTVNFFCMSCHVDMSYLAFLTAVWRQLMFVCSELLSVKYTNHRFELGIRFETVLFMSSEYAANCAQIAFSG